VQKKTQKILGVIIIVAAFGLYFYKPIVDDLFNVFLGVMGAIGISLLLGWFNIE